MVDLANEQLELKDAERRSRHWPMRAGRGRSSDSGSHAQLLATVAAARQPGAGDSVFKSTFDAARAAAAAHDTGVDRAQDYQQIALELAACGDIAGARAMVERMDDTTGVHACCKSPKFRRPPATMPAQGDGRRQRRKPRDLEQGLLPIALGQARAGDLAAARATPREIHDKYDAMNAQGRHRRDPRGRYTGALGTAHHLAADPWSELEAYADISLAQADRHDLAGTARPQPAPATWRRKSIQNRTARSAGHGPGESSPPPRPARVMTPAPGSVSPIPAADKGDEQDTFGGAGEHERCRPLPPHWPTPAFSTTPSPPRTPFPSTGWIARIVTALLLPPSSAGGDLAGTLRWIETVIPDAQPLGTGRGGRGIAGSQGAGGR